jgi:hypothetical protein
MLHAKHESTIACIHHCIPLACQVQSGFGVSGKSKTPQRQPILHFALADEQSPRWQVSRDQGYADPLFPANLNLMNACVHALRLVSEGPTAFGRPSVRFSGSAGRKLPVVDYLSERVGIYGPWKAWTIGQM